MADDFDPLSGKPPCPYTREDCLPGCEHGYAGPCERNRLSYDEDRWQDITHVGSVHEIQWNPVTGAYRHRPLSLGVDGQPDRRWRDREWISGPPPGESRPINDNVDGRIEAALEELERSVLEVTQTVQEFRSSVRLLGRGLKFAFWVFALIGGIVILSEVMKLFHSG